MHRDAFESGYVAESDGFAEEGQDGAAAAGGA